MWKNRGNALARFFVAAVLLSLPTIVVLKIYTDVAVFSASWFSTVALCGFVSVMIAFILYRLNEKLNG